MKDPPADTGVS